MLSGSDSVLLGIFYISLTGSSFQDVGLASSLNEICLKSLVTSSSVGPHSAEEFEECSKVGIIFYQTQIKFLFLCMYNIDCARQKVQRRMSASAGEC